MGSHSTAVLSPNSLVELSPEVTKLPPGLSGADWSSPTVAAYGAGTKRGERQCSQLLGLGVLRAPQQVQQVQGGDAWHVASADLQHAHQALCHGSPKAFHLQRRANKSSDRWLAW